MTVSGTVHKGLNPFLEANNMRYIVRIEKPYEMDYVIDELSNLKNVRLILTNKKRNYIVVESDIGIIGYLETIVGVTVDPEPIIPHYTLED